MTRLTLLLMTVLAGGSIVIACAPSEEETAEGESSIVGGAEARRHEHAALVDIDRGTIGGACSGSVIAPRVVLTAGHCVQGALGFTVTTPFSGRQKARGRGLVYDYNSTADRVNPNQHDVGLIILDAPIRLAKYPRLQRAPLVADTPITKIGRIQDGRLSNTALYESSPMRVVDGRAYGYPFSYVSSEIIQSGDSGGPDVIAASDPPIIVAVNSGAGGGTEVLARVDLLSTWIDTQVAANGGYAKPADGGVEAGADAGNEAGADAGKEAGVDAAKEAGVPDSGSTGNGDGGGNGTGDGGGNGDGGGTADSGSSPSSDPGEPAPGSNESPDRNDPESPSSSEDDDQAPTKAKKKKFDGASSGCTTSTSSAGAAARGGGFLLLAILAGAVAAARRKRRS